MFGFWYLVIASSVLIVIGAVLLFINEGAQLYSDAMMVLGIAITIISAICFIVFLIVSITFPLNAQKEYTEFLEQKALIEETIKSGEEYDNVAINQSIIEANKWLSAAKADKKTYGCFSDYYNIDLESIEPIKRPKNI